MPEKKEELIQATKEDLSRDGTVADQELDKDRATGECEGNSKEKDSYASPKSVRWELCRAVTLGFAVFLYIIVGGIGYESIALPARNKYIESTRLKHEEFLDALAVLLAQDEGNLSIDVTTVEENRAKVLLLMKRLCTSSNLQQTRVWTFDGAFLLVTSVITTIGG